MKKNYDSCFNYFEFIAYVIYDLLSEGEKILNEYGGV